MANVNQENILKFSFQLDGVDEAGAEVVDTFIKDTQTASQTIESLMGQDGYSDYFEALSRAQGTMQAMAASAKSMVTSMGSAFDAGQFRMYRDSFMDMMRTAERIRGSINDISHNIGETKRDKINERFNVTSAMSGAGMDVVESMGRVAEAGKGLQKIGFKQQEAVDFARRSQSIVRDVLGRAEAKDYDQALSVLWNDKNFQRMVKDTYVAKGNVAPIPDSTFVKLAQATLAFGNHAQGRSNLMAAPFKAVKVNMSPADLFPEFMRSAYNGKAMATPDVNVNSFSKGDLSSQVYDSLIAMATRKGKENTYARDLLLKAGVIDFANGKIAERGGAIVHRGSIPLDVARWIGSQAFSDAAGRIAGSPQYFKNKNEFLDRERMREKSGANFEQIQEVMEALALDKNIGYVPASGGHEQTAYEAYRSDATAKYGMQSNPVKDEKGRYVYSAARGQIPAFAIPHAHINPETGKIQYTKNITDWRKTNGVKEQREDEVVMQEYSQMLRLLGYNPEYENTWGEGRDAKTLKPTLTKATPLVTMDISTLYGRDEKGQYTKKLDTKLANTAARQITGKLRLGYDKAAGDYEVGWIKSTSDTMAMIESGLKQSIDKRFNDAGMPSPFEAFNIAGTYYEKDYAKTTKQRNAVSYMATPGQSFAHYGQIWSQDADKSHVALIDEESMYKLFQGLNPTDDRGRKNYIDAGSMFMPGTTPMEGQMRGAVAKFMGQEYDWKMQKEHEVFERDTNGNFIIENGRRKIRKDALKENPFLEVDENDKLHFYLPGFNAMDAITPEVRKYIETKTGTKLDENAVIGASWYKDYAKSAEGMAFLSRPDIRSQYMTDVMGEDINQLLLKSSVKNEDKFSKLTPAMYEGMFGKKAPTRRDEKGNVLLSANEANAYYQKALSMIGGNFLVHSTEDFDITRDEWVESLTNAFGIPASAIARQNQEYIAELEDLKTTSGQIAYLERSGYYRKQANQNGMDYFKSGEAQRQIQQRVEELQRRISSGSVKIGGDKVMSKVAKMSIGSMATLMGMNEKTAPTDEWKSMIGEGAEDYVYIEGDTDFGDFFISRQPSAPGQYKVLKRDKNTDRIIQMMASTYGGGKEGTGNAIYISPQALDELNTGDFDGDTVWAMATQMLGTDAEAATARAQQIKDSVEAAWNRVDPAFKDFVEGKGRDDKRSVQQVMEGTADKPGIVAPGGDLSEEEKKFRSYFGLGLFDTLSKQTMGGAVAVMRNAMQATDDDAYRWMAIAQASKIYDLATSDMKKKGLTELDNIPMEYTKFLGMGSATRRVFHEVENILNDETGLLVPTKDTLLKGNVPSINDPNALGVSLVAFRARRDGKMTDDVSRKDLEDIYNRIGYDPTSAEGMAIREYLDLMSDAATGVRVIRGEDTAKLRKLATAWESDIGRRGGAALNKEEYARLQKFGRRIEFAESGKAQNESSFKALVTSSEKALEDMKIRDSAAYGLFEQRYLEEEREELAKKRGEEYIPNADAAAAMRAIKESEELKSKYNTYARYKFEGKAAKEILEADEIYRNSTAYKTQMERRDEDRERSDILAKMRRKSDGLFVLPETFKPRTSYSALNAWFNPEGSAISAFMNTIRTTTDGSEPAPTTALKIRNLLGRDAKVDLENPFVDKNGTAKLNQVLSDLYGEDLAIADTPLGKAIHTVMENSAKQEKFNSSESEFIVKNLEKLLGSEEYTKEFAKAGVKYNADTHTFSADGSVGLMASDATIKRLNEKLKVVGGKAFGGTGGTSLKAFMESIITAGEKIVQVESDVFDTNGTLLKTTRERVEFPLEKIGEKKQSSVQYASYTIAPDLVTEDAEGALHVYDYKSSAHGSTKSLAQSLAYIALAKQDYEKQGNASPFTRWFDKDGKLRIKDVTGYDFTTGTETTLSLEGNEGLLTGFVDEIRKAALQKTGDYSNAKDIIERALSSGDFGELFGSQESSPVIQALMKKSLATRNMTKAESDRVKRLWEASASEVALEHGTAANITSASGSIDVANQAELAAANFAFGQMSRIQEEQGNISSNLWKAKRQHEALPGGDSDLLRLYKDAAKLDAEAMKNQDIVARYANAITEATSKTGSTGMNSVAEVYHEVMSKSGNLVQAIADEISGSADFRMSRLEHRVSGQEADKEQLASMSRISYLSRLAQTANAEADAIFQTFGLSTETDEFGNKKRIATATRGAAYAATAGASDKVANKDKVIAGQYSAAQFVNDTIEEIDGKMIITGLGKEHETYLQMRDRADKLSQDVDEEIRKERETYSKNLAMRSEGLFGAHSKMNVLSSPERYAQLTAIGKEVDAEIDAMNQDLLKTPDGQAKTSIIEMVKGLTSFSEAIKTSIGEIDPKKAKRELQLGAKSGLFKMEDILNADLGGLGLTQDELMGMYRDIAQNQSARDNLSTLAKISSLTKGKTVSDLLAEKSFGANRNQDVAAIAKAFGITSMDEVDKLIKGKYRGMTGTDALAAIDTIKAYDIMNAGSKSAEAGREAARKDRMSILESRYNKDIKDLNNIEDRLVGIGARAGGKKLDIPTVDELVERYKLALAGELESIIKENESIIGDKHATNEQKSAAKKRIENATKSYQDQMADLDKPDSAVIKSIKDSNYDVAMRTISNAFSNKYMQELYAARDKDVSVAKAWDEIKSNRDLTDSEKKFIKKYKLDYGHEGYASYEDMFKARTAAGSYGLEGSIMGNAYKNAVYMSMDDIRADQLRELEALGPNSPGYRKANIVNKYAKIMQNSQDYLEGSLEAQLANLTGVDLSGNKPIGMSRRLAEGEYDLKSTKLINNLRENLLPFYEKKEGGMAELEGIIKQYQDTIASQRDRVVRNMMNREGVAEMRNAEMEAESDTIAQQNYRLAMANVQGRHVARSSSFGKNFRTMLARQSILGYGFTMTEGAREQAQHQLDQIAAQEEMLNARMQESNERLSAADGYFEGNTERVRQLQALGDADLKRLIGDRGTNIDINGTSYEAISQQQYAALMRNRNLAREMEVLGVQKGNAQALMGANSGIGGLAKGLGLSMTSLVSRFIGQKLKQAYQLAKQEMMSFDTEMSTIQGITLMSDEEMGSVKQNVVANAKKYKTSISQVSSATGALYRQGLNEEQVNQRLGSVIQLSKVAGIDTNTSNEVITMLLQTGLYSSAESAADAIAALGDAAATTAAQLTKALKKTAVSASEYGVSGGELNALLTAILEDTQLSGNIVGTGVNTILNRLNKVASGDELVTDENGNTTSTGTIATALRYVGVNLYEGEGQAAKMRNPFDILEDLASGWEQYSDFDKQRISTALGGQGRNATTFLEMMDALGENGVDRYRELRQVERESSGVLGEKYDVMTDNVATTIETIKTEWQSIWTDDAAINMLQALLDGFKGFVDIVGEAENPLLALIAPMSILAGLSAMIHGGTAGLIIGAGMVLGGGIGMGVTAIKNWGREQKAEELKNTPGTKEYYMAQHEEHQQKYDDYNTLLDRIEATKLKFGDDKYYADMTQDEKVQSLNALYEVIDNFDSAEDAAAALSDFQSGVVSFAETMDRVAREIKERQNKEFEESLTTAMNAYAIEGGYSESFSNYTKNGIKGMSYIVDANGNYRLVQDKVAALYDEANKYDIRTGDYKFYTDVQDKLQHDRTITNNEAERLTGVKNAMDYFFNPSFRSNSMFTYSYVGNDVETLDDYVNLMAAEKVGDLSEPIREDYITGPLNILETFGPKLERLSLDEWLEARGLPVSTSSPFYRAEPKAPEPMGELPELSPNYDPEVIQRAYDTIANSPYEKYGLTPRDSALATYMIDFYNKSQFMTETVARMKDLQKQGLPVGNMEEIINTTPADAMRSIAEWLNDESGLVRNKNGEIFTITDDHGDKYPVNLSRPSNPIAKEFLEYYGLNFPKKDENGMYDFGSEEMKTYVRKHSRLNKIFSPFIDYNFTDEGLAGILEFFDGGEEDYEEALSRVSEYERILSENAEAQAEIDRIEGEYATKTAKYQKDIAEWREDIEKTKERFSQRDAAIPLYYSEYLPEMDAREKASEQAKAEAIAAAEKERDFQNTTIALKNQSDYENYMFRQAAYAEEQERLRSEIESNMLENYNFVTNDEGQIIGYYNKKAGRESVQGEDKTFYGTDPYSDDALVKYEFKATDKTRGEVAEMQKRFIALNDALTNEANKFTREQIYTDYLLEQDVFSTLLSTMGTRLGVTEKRMAEFVSGKINADTEKYFNEDNTANAEAIVELFKQLYYNEEETKATYAAETGTQDRIFDYMYTTKDGITYYSDTKDFSGAVYRKGDATELTTEDIGETIDKGEVRYAKTGIKVSPSLMDMSGILTEEDKGYKTTTDAILEAFKKSKIDGLPTSISELSDIVGVDVPSLEPYLASNKEAMKILEELIVQENGGKKTAYTVDDFIAAVMKDNGTEDLIETEKSAATHVTSQYLASETARAIKGGVPLTYSQMQAVAEYNNVSLDAYRANAAGFNAEYLYGFNTAENKILAGINAETQNYRASLKPTIRKAIPTAVAFGENPYLIPEEIQKYIDMGYIYDPETGTFTGIDYSKFSSDDLLASSFELSRMQTAELKSPLGVARGELTKEQKAMIASEEFRSKYAAYSAAYSGGMSDEVLGYLSEYYKTGRMGIGSGTALLEAYGLGSLLTPLEGGEFAEGQQAGMFEQLEKFKDSQPEVYELLNSLYGLDSVMKALSSSERVASDGLEDFTDGIKRSDLLDKYSEDADKVAAAMEAFGKDAQKSAAAMTSLNSSMNKVANNRFYRMKFAEGDTEDETIKSIMEQTGLGEEFVRNADNKAAVQAMLNTVDASELLDMQTLVDGFNESLSQEQINLIGPDFIIGAGNVSIDSDMGAQVASMLDPQQQAMIEQLQAYGFTAHWEEIVTDKGASVQLVLDSLGTGAKTTKSGGGGGGKSAAAKLIEKWKNLLKTPDHMIKMIQAQETKYEQLGELGNLNNMIALENVAQEDYKLNLLDEIEALKEQMGKTKKESEDWYSLRDAIFEAEEAYEAANNAIDANNKKMRENQQAIYKTRTDLEDTVKQAIDEADQKERDMLAGTVSMQETILDVIEQRYRDEWDLISKDIDKKREALDEEKSLIDERLQMRKDAEDQARKYEELAEYQRQYALISMDSTRTKDATELLKKINDLQTELAWDTAENEADAQKEALDDKSEAYSQFQTIASEDLEALLRDATNFTVDVNDVLKMSFNEMMQWLSDSVEQFSISLDESQQQMLDSWEDTFRQMKGITGQYGEDLYGLDRTYGEVPNVLETKESFMGRMMQTDQYLNAISDEERWQMLYQWAELYDNWVAAQKNGATYAHDDDWLGLGTNGDSGAGKYKYSYEYGTYAGNGTGYATKDQALAAAASDINNQIANYKANLASRGYNPTEIGIMTENLKNTLMNGTSISAYANGGLVDYTGLAWVDGSPMRPEAFLSADDTAMIRTMIDSLSRVMHNPYMTMINPADFGGSSSTIGDINVTINQAEITDDRSIEDLANRVGEALVDELAKTGFNTGRFSF